MSTSLPPPCPLECGVMTSSAARYLASLFAEVAAINRVDRFDLMILRDTDMIDMARTPGLESVLDGAGVPRRVTEVFHDHALTPSIAEWFRQRCDKANVKVPALATYFPDITSDDAERRQDAVNALVQTALIALRLKKTGVMTNAAIVEIVAGTILDPHEVELEGKMIRLVFAYDRMAKLDQLCKSLEETIRQVANAVAQAPADYPADPRICFAVELEPGPSYVLGDGQDEKAASLSMFIEMVKRSPALNGCVGLNLDIAHWLIANIDPQILATNTDVRDRIVHCHVADHPGKKNGRTHARDLPLGSFTTVEQWDEGEYYGYLQQLCELGTTLGSRQTSLPFSGTISIELEGNNRIFWLHDSITRLRHAILATHHRAIARHRECAVAHSNSSGVIGRTP